MQRPADVGAPALRQNPVVGEMVRPLGVGTFGGHCKEKWKGLLTQSLAKGSFARVWAPQSGNCSEGGPEIGHGTVV